MDILILIVLLTNCAVLTFIKFPNDKKESWIIKYIFLLLVMSSIVYAYLGTVTEGGSRFKNKFSSTTKSVTVTPIPTPPTSSTNTVPTPAIYLELKGGLGNQLFQYACSYSLSRKYNLPLFFQVPKRINKRSFASNERMYGLDYFQLGYDHTVVDESCNFSTPLNKLNDRDLLARSFYGANKILKHIDYCQSESFFALYKPEILSFFQFTKLELIEPPVVLGWKEKIGKAEGSVAIHIRRGDLDILNRIPAEFYKTAIQQMACMLSPISPTFFIFTDEGDQNKLKTEFKFLFNSNVTTHLVSNSSQTNSIQEFYLMKSCRHQIIPNSSFSWWAAYLNSNPDKIVISAHYNPKYLDSIYNNVEEAKYYKFQYRYLYYPQNFFAIDPFNVTVF